ncbi:hypothetical protein SO694_00204018 [Aureococcus anophagefferens]|uniref:Anaphase-promoting complex subunit 4 WD40 domain-containing protein n=1 Tax=Aureococcus anophagefferens TaxID=44056 RepID=A0ABR1FNP8_AURAN
MFALEAYGACVASARAPPGAEAGDAVAEDRSARLWAARRGALVATFEGHAASRGAALTCVAFSRDRRRVATAGGPTDAEVHDVSTGRLAFALRGHKGRVAWVRVDRSGARLATASADRTARLWDATDGRALVQFRGHQDAVSCVALDAAGAAAAACGAEGNVLLFPVRAAYRKLGPRAATPVVEAIRSLDNHVYSFRRLAFSPDGSRSASPAPRKSAVPRRPRARSASSSSTTAPSTRSSSLTTARRSSRPRPVAGPLGRGPRCRPRSTGAGRRFVGRAENVVAAAFSGDDARLATASHDGTGRLWDAASGELLLTFTGHADRVSCVGVSPTRVAAACHDGCARVWDATKPVFLKRWRGHGGAAVRCVSFSDHAEKRRLGRRDAARARLGPARASGVPFSPRRDTMALPRSTGRVARGKLDGRRRKVVAARERSGMASLHDALRSGEADADAGLESARGHARAVRALGYSGDGRLLATASGRPDARLAVQAGHLVATLRGHVDRVTCCAVSLDGSRVATASRDRTAAVWSADGRAARVLEGHSRPLWAVAFSGDGRLVATGGADKTVRLWRSTSGEAAVLIRGRRSAAAATFRTA